jgi:hypothetical protein
MFQTTIQNLDNPISRRVRGVIQKIREERFGYMKVSQKSILSLPKVNPIFEEKNTNI